ncbi:Histidine-containing phosphotransfer protein 4 [Euphorbia peplus]|nr:Histidine-containing phosphotransfer protein 4 [Euphorbia peplus]
MESKHLFHQVGYVRKSLFDQGYLDEQFMQLEDLQDEANPNFVEEIVSSFYTDSVRLLHNIDITLSKRPVDFCKLDNYMHQYKGSCSSIGAKKVRRECSEFREYCSAGNTQGCITTFQQLKQEHTTLRRKLETYFQLIRQAAVAGQPETS